MQFELAHQELDVWVEDFKPDVGEDLYAATVEQITVQLALQPLRAKGGKNNLDEFTERCALAPPCMLRLGPLRPPACFAGCACSFGALLCCQSAHSHAGGGEEGGAKRAQSARSHAIL